MNYLFEHYPEHALSLDVNAENTQAVNFYRKNGLRIHKIYITPEPDNVEFALFETPLDKKGKKLDVNDPDMYEKACQPYFDKIEDFYNFNNSSSNEETHKKEEIQLDNISNDNTIDSSE